MVDTDIDLGRLIVVACVVEMGEVMARLIVHATQSSKAHAAIASSLIPVSREDALRTLEQMILQSQPSG